MLLIRGAVWFSGGVKNFYLTFDMIIPNAHDFIQFHESDVRVNISHNANVLLKAESLLFFNVSNI